MAYLPSWKNLANESLRNCDVRQVLCNKTFSAVFKPKNVCTFVEFSSFQSFQSEIILVKCCKEVSAPLLKVSFFPNFPCLTRNIFVYIFRTDENPFGSCQPCSNNIHITYDDNTAAHRATCDISAEYKLLTGKCKELLFIENISRGLIGLELQVDKIVTSAW